MEQLKHKIKLRKKEVGLSEKEQATERQDTTFSYSVQLWVTTREWQICIWQNLALQSHL